MQVHLWGVLEILPHQLFPHATCDGQHVLHGFLCEKARQALGSGDYLCWFPVASRGIDWEEPPLG